MRRGWKITLVALSLLLVSGTAIYFTLWPKILLQIVLNSYPREPWVEKFIQEGIVLVVYDEKTEKELGKSTPETFRKALLQLLPLHVVETRGVVMLDIYFESETPVDNLLQQKLDENSNKIVWARTAEKKSRFLRRHTRYSPPQPLPLGHINLAHSTVLGRTKLQLVPFCVMTKDKEALPPIALLTYQTYFGGQMLNTDNCAGWEWGTPMITHTYTYRLGVTFTINHQIKDIPHIIDKTGRRWFPIRYMGPEGFFKRVSMIDVLEKRVSREELRDKIVLVGVTVPDDVGYRDRHLTEVGEMDGIEVQANILATIMRALIRKAN